MSLSLVILAAGMSTRYGRLKQLEPVGPGGAALLDYAIHDALRAGFARVVFVVRAEIREAIARHVEARWPGLPVAFAEQALDQVPPGRAVPPGRTKPWGTAHAVLAARAAVDGPFAVANADDFYGREAYGALAGHLTAGTGEQALVGYRIEATLSESGGVSRGICALRGDAVVGITELLDVRRAAGGPTGRDTNGTAHTVPSGAVASMNLWGFTPEVFDVLGEAFAAFVDVPDGLERREFLLSSALGDAAGRGRIRLRALRTDARWMGMTFPDDRARVAAALASFTDAGTYPADLGAGERS